MRLAAAGVPVGQLTAVCITHLHSDHITDLNDVITAMWITTFEPTPLRIIGPPGTKRGRRPHPRHRSAPTSATASPTTTTSSEPPLLEITETDGVGHARRVGRARPRDDRRPPITARSSRASRSDSTTTASAWSSPATPCHAPASTHCVAGADALVHTVIRKDIIANIPIQRLQDTLDYHSSPEEAAQTAERAGVGTLVLTHYVPTIPPGGGDDWRELAAQHFTGRVELGDDLHRVTIPSRDIRRSEHDMKTLRTPDERFEGLDGYPFEPHYADIARRRGTARCACTTSTRGPPDAAPVLLLHGEPSWSYLYRHMIPPLVAAGHRVIAPDLVGFGRSDKPTEQTDYTYARHVEWMRELLFDHLDLRDITFFGQDWGGLVGLRLLAARTRSLRPGGDRQHRPADRSWSGQRRVHGLAEVLTGVTGVRHRIPRSTAAPPPT